MKGRPRFYVEAEGPDLEAVRRGLAWLAEAAERSGGAQAVLAMPTKQNLWGTVSEAIGEQAAKALEAGGAVSLKRGVSLRLVTQRMWLHPSTPTPVLCVYVTESHLKKVDATPNVSEMCVVPWTMDELQSWIQTWAALPWQGSRPL